MRVQDDSSSVTKDKAVDSKPYKTPSDAAAERRLTLKIDLAVLPVVSLLYLFCFINRTTIGNAKIAGLDQELGLRGYDFNIALTCFAVAYALCKVPATICCKWIGPGWFLPGCTVAFGLAAVGTGLVQTRTQLFVVRALLGIFESGLMPGIAYYLSRWYRRAELSFRLSFYIAAAAVAGGLGGVLASAILRLPRLGSLDGWRTIFVIEGVVTITLGIVGLVVMTDRPETARWLTDVERQVVADRIVAERVSPPGQLLDKMDSTKIKRGLANPVVLATATLFFMDTITVGALSFFLPTVVATIYPDASVAQQQLYTVAPCLLGAVLTLAFSALSWWLDRRQDILILSGIPVLIANALFLSTQDTHVRYAAVFLVAGTCFVPGALANAQVSANVVSDTSRSAAIAVNVFIGSLGTILSTWTFLPFDAPFYRIGNGINLAGSGAWLLIGAGTMFWMHFDNKKKDAVHVGDALSRLTLQEAEALDWKHPDFRWKP